MIPHDSHYLMPLFRFLFLPLILIAMQPSHAFVIDSGVEKLNLLNHVEIFVDKSRHVQSDEIISHPERFAFKSTALLSSEVNFGFSNAVYWIKIPLSNTSTIPSNWILELPYLGLDEVCFYAPGKPVVTSGATAPIETRPFRYRYFSFPLSLTADNQNFYLRVESKYAVTVPLVLYSLAGFNNEQVTDTLIQALYYGGLLSLLFYNLILFITVKDRKYLIYCCFTGFTGLGVFAGNGYARLYLWGHAVAWDQISQSALFAVAGIFAMVFTSSFLNAKYYQPKFRIVLNGIGLTYLALFIALIVTLFTSAISRELVFRVFFITTLLASFACLYGSFVAIRLGQTSAYYFGLAWGALATGAIIASLRAFQLVPSNGFTLYALQIGSGFEMLLFSFALAYRIQSERALREQAQSETLVAKQSALEAMRISEERLEKAVEQRTEKLQHLLINEQEIHNQYVRFGAMIAHEFRNPLNIIEGQTSMLELESEAGINKTQKRAAAIRTATTRLASLFEQWLQSDRLSQPGSQLDLSKVYLGAMLESLIQNSQIFHPEHSFTFNPPEIDTEIECDNHLLQIAILNLIENACKYSPECSTITLQIQTTPKEIGIGISDQGCGIDPKDIGQIFDVYYRGVAETNVKGAGLGLAFVSKIAQLHGGRAEVVSQLNIGSTFTIWLPL